MLPAKRRAPLTAIDGYCGLILGQQLGPISDEQQEVLERMQHSIKRLSRMATAMFQLSVGRQIEKAPSGFAGSCSRVYLPIGLSYVPTRRNARRYRPRQEGCGDHICSDSRRWKALK